MSPTSSQRVASRRGLAGGVSPKSRGLRLWAGLPSYRTLSRSRSFSKSLRGSLRSRRRVRCPTCCALSPTVSEPYYGAPAGSSGGAPALAFSAEGPRRSRGADGRARRSPASDAQPLDAPEVPLVPGRHRQAVDQRGRRDLQIVGSDDLAPRAQVRPDARVMARHVEVERQHGDEGKDRLDEGLPPAALPGRPGAVGPVQQLAGRDRGDGHGRVPHVGPGRGELPPLGRHEHAGVDQVGHQVGHGSRGSAGCAAWTLSRSSASPASARSARSCASRSRTVACTAVGDAAIRAIVSPFRTMSKDSPLYRMRSSRCDRLRAAVDRQDVVPTS